MAKTKTIRIRPLEGYTKVSDDEVVSRGTAVVTGMTGNPNFPASPVDLKVLKTDIDNLAALIAESHDGSKKVFAQKNKQRVIVIDMLRLLGRYVEVISKGDMAIFQSSGLQSASTAKAPTEPLPMPAVPNVTHGAVTGQLLVQLKKVPKAKSYELRYAAMANGAPGNWTKELVTSVKKPFAVNGLTPATTYAFQVRATGKLGYTDWTDSATCMCT